jgi:hypothetical protein
MPYDAIVIGGVPAGYGAQVCTAVEAMRKPVYAAVPEPLQHSKPVCR